jgi:hypothetical protein
MPLNTTPEYRALHDAIQRCHNPDHPNYRLYGARGIHVCDAWRPPRGFSAFIAHIGRRPAKHMSLDRIDNNGNYEPGNVRWATPHQQLANKRTTRMLTYCGHTMCLSAWCRLLGFPHNMIHRRLKAGWSVERAIETPSRKGSK